MNILFIGGHKGAGKTELFCFMKPDFNIKEIRSNGLDGKDYLALCQDKKGKKFVVNSSSDEKQQIDTLINFIKEKCSNGVLVEDLILAIRSSKDSMRDYLIKSLKDNDYLREDKEITEFPLAHIDAKIKNGTDIWYKDTCKANIFRILNQSPFLITL